MEVIEENNVYTFDLKQHKDSYDDFCIAFDNAIKKRALNNNTQENKIGLCLSGAYDSGAISCSLNKINTNYVSYSMKCQENMKVLKERLDLNKNKNFYDISQETYQEFKKYMSSSRWCRRI